MGLMVLQVRPTPTRFSTYILYSWQGPHSYILCQVCDARGVCFCCCLGITPRAQLLRAWLLLDLIGDEAPSKLLSTHRK